LQQGTHACLSQNFYPWRTVGTLTQLLRLYTRRSCDELLILNPGIATITDLTDRFFNIIINEVDIPIAYAGGIRSSLDAQLIINKGFDKVFITSAFIDDHKILASISKTLGSQSIGVSLPYVNISGEYFVWDYRLKKPTSSSLLHSLHDAISYGAGEIMLHSVRHDGQLSGFDQNLDSILEQVSSSIPILLAGGFSTPDDFRIALSNPRINAAVASSLFSLTEHTPTTIRTHCLSNNILMRNTFF
jgi:cyclase